VKFLLYFVKVKSRYVNPWRCEFFPTHQKTELQRGWWQGDYWAYLLQRFSPGGI